MGDNCYIVKEDATVEIVVKKSRFISHIYYVESEQEALNHIAAMKKKYYDARHNCYAYSIGEDRSIEKSSDDGEPSGTAGRPILEVIHGENVVNVLVVVTRYFGGTLLGTGGLVRAYTDSTVEGLKQTGLLLKIKGYHMNVALDYSVSENFKHVLTKNGITSMDIEYGENVVFSVDVPSDVKDILLKSITEMTAGKGIADLSDETWIYAETNNGCDTK